MPIYVTRERDNAKEEQPEQESTDDRYHHVEEKIRMTDINMTAMTTKMDALMT